MHSREADDVIDYEYFLTWAARLPRTSTRVQVRSDLVFVIERADERDGFFAFTFISGDPSEIPLFFNDESGKVEKNSPGDESWPVRQTNVIMDPATRLVAIENRRAGVGSNNLERYFQLLAKEQGFASDLLFDLNIQPSPSFQEELDRFVRIREATVVVKRPNTDWDDAEDILAELADETGAHTASVTVNAARGESLNRNDGLMEVIRSQVSRPQTSVSNVRVVGTKDGETQERSLSLSRHQVKREVRFSPGETAGQMRSSVVESAMSLIHSTAQILGLVR